MKRSQTTEGSSDAPQQKKAKTTPESSVGAEDDGGWTKVEKRKQKKVKKTESKLDTTQPRFLYAQNEIIKRNRAIGIEEIRDLILYIVADAPPPNWIRVDNAQLIDKVVAVLIPGLTAELLSLPPLPTVATSNPNIPLSIPLLPKNGEGELAAASIPFIASTFSHACPTRAPGDTYRMHSVLSAFFHGPVSSEERNRRVRDRLASENVKYEPTKYLLTLEQMIENDYPIPSYMSEVFQKDEGWMETPEPPKEQSTTEEDKNAPKQQIYAIDCEMCTTEDGKELTHVSIIDYYSGILVYDQLVKPRKPILDYLTRWSGITAQSLENVTTTHAEVQAHVMKLLSPPASNPFSVEKKSASPPLTPILLGHSLESDLKALKICHPLCIDTALMYHHPRGRPLKPGLAWLTKKWCGREIQARGEGGHNPEEDARACLDLLKKKIQEGPNFGEFKVDQESIFERMSRSRRRAGGAAGTIKSAVVDHGNPSVMHGSKATTSIGCKSDDEVIKALLEVIPSHHFTFARFTALADKLGWTTPKASPDAPPTEAAPPPSHEELKEILTTLNGYLKTLHEFLPPRSALVIFTGHSDPRRMAMLNARKNLFESALRSGKNPEELDPDLKWSNSDARELEEAVELAKRGLLFLGVKQ